jgi:tRNA pseudouridine38/39 synthase
VKVALKLCYDGREYGGLAMQENNRNTVEQYLNEAMRRSMLVCNLVENKYSRSGRTDKGVSAAGQVVALYLRHNPN